MERRICWFVPSTMLKLIAGAAQRAAGAGTSHVVFKLGSEEVLGCAIAGGIWSL